MIVTLSGVSNAATVAEFLLVAVPQANALVKKFRGTGLQAPAETACFVLETLQKCMDHFTVLELDRIMKMYANLRKRMDDVEAEGKLDVPKDRKKSGKAVSAKAKKEKAFWGFLGGMFKFLKDSQTASNTLSQLIQDAERYRTTAVTLSERAVVRAGRTTRNRLAAQLALEDGGVGIDYGPSEFTDSYISLLLPLPAPCPPAPSLRAPPKITAPVRLPPPALTPEVRKSTADRQENQNPFESENTSIPLSSLPQSPSTVSLESEESLYSQVSALTLEAPLSAD
ncbi:hypothetical protein FB45DRAFT_1068376 [Roridomyces roridus]|uniref:Uncharacterized protein n=1 Tax=Roridomyces roridus TaxID=1738132 RepID=A0AAD7B0C9_9AGAR|nr:hypothetical protein FB45DRAFT_1068376 [Roridomyces roridus]